jgi:hypothetical protein
MEQIISIVSVPAIATIVYWVVNLIKFTVNGSEKFKRLIPIISAVLGAGLGCVAFYIAPEIIIADNLITAIIIGGASGLSATGTNQIIKQLEKSEKDKED